MGYYTGSGVVSDGGYVIEQQDSVQDGGTLVRECRTKTLTTVYRGVALATAQAKSPSSATKCGDLAAAGYVWATPHASGYKVNYSYSQVNGSNLYTLTQTREEYQKRLCARNGAGTLNPGDWMALPT